jgi:hypothetical protein
MLPMVSLAKGVSSGGDMDDGSAEGPRGVALYTTHDISVGTGSHAVVSVGIRVVTSRHGQGSGTGASVRIRVKFPLLCY